MVLKFPEPNFFSLFPRKKPDFHNKEYSWIRAQQIDAEEEGEVGSGAINTVT
jgi:hypothetical protein